MIEGTLTMPQQPICAAWKITCRSADDALALQVWLSGRISLERELADAVHTYRNGLEQVQVIQHRLGSYFADIRILPDLEANPTAFRLVFRRRPEAGRFWKDLMVDILQEVESTPQKACVTLQSKTNVE